MAEAPGLDVIGRGIYTIPEAAHLAAIARRTIRRWLLGYDFRASGELRHSAPVVYGDYPIIDGVAAVSFLDLQEIRFVDAFRKRGVSWKTLRETHERAQEILKNRHPFSTGRFVTDGRSILLDAARGSRDGALLNIVRHQLEFKRIVAPFLKELDFAADQVVRWWPPQGHRRVVVDPQRSFGQPIVKREGVPTRVLATAYAAEKSFETVARWYEVAVRSVRDAVEFEEQLAAAA